MFEGNNELLIQKFVAERRAEGKAARTLLKDIYTLNRLNREFPDFRNLTRERAIDGFNKLRDEVKPNTYRDYLLRMRLFMKWFYKSPRGQLPPVVEWISPGSPHRKLLSREDMLTDNEVEQIIKFAKTTRDKALIRLIFETGLRAGELINLRVGDFTPAEVGGFYLRIDGTKTDNAQRIIPVVKESVINAINAWLEEHPLRNQANFKNTPLWVKTNGKPIGYRAFYKMLGETQLRAGITDKPHNPHNYRHSRATLWCNTPGLTQSQYEHMLGWRQGSSMPSIYQHTNEQDTLIALLAIERSKTAKQTHEDEIHKLFAEISVDVMLQKPEIMNAIRREVEARWAKEHGAKLHLPKLRDGSCFVCGEPVEESETLTKIPVTISPANMNFLSEAPRGLDKKSSRKKGLKGGGRK